MLPTINPTKTAAWQALEQHFGAMQNTQMKDLFAADNQRFHKFSTRFEEILVDYSKNIITDETLNLLVQLAEETHLKAAIEAMFSGQKINQTEKRAVLHVALRNQSNTPIEVDGENVMPHVNAVLAQVEAFSKKIISGDWKGFTGKGITDIVNIGIGGSDLVSRKLLIFSCCPIKHDM